jgi:ABC-type uncharacterized transport system permease subunit
MQKIEEQMNRLTDMDAGWWPFLHLRPEQDQEMDNAKLLHMSIYFGPFYGVILALAISFALGSFSAVASLACVAATTLYFFFAYKFTFALFWNRRARRLKREAGKSAA